MNDGRLIRTLVVDDEAPAREALRVLLESDPEVEVCGACADGHRALAAIEARRPDLVFLDVQMPGMDGFEVLDELARRRGEDGLPCVVFVTAFDRYALRAFEVVAVDFLLKPFGDARFWRALARAKTRLSAHGAQARLAELLRTRAAGCGERRPERFAVKDGSGVSLIPLEDIRWFEARDHYVLVHSSSGSHLVRRAMGELEAELDPGAFVRVHRGAIVNARQVTELRRGESGAGELTLACGARLRVSRRRFAALKARLGR